MTYREFEALCHECEDMLRDAAPYDTGNLSHDAIKFEMIDANTCRLYVEEGSGGTLSRPPGGYHGIAPYMKYTNEPWTNGKKNPNEGWFDRAVKKIAQHIAERTRGALNNDTD